MWGKFEPLLNAYTITALASAILTVAVAFNVPITPDERDALLGLVAAVIGIFGLGVVAARNVVTPVAKVQSNIIPLVPAYNQPRAVAALTSGEKAV